jgi:hypothetical protein
LKRLFLRSDGRLSVVGWIVLMVVAVVPTIMIAGALDLPPWADWPVSIVWIFAVTLWARRVLGVRF